MNIKFARALILLGNVISATPGVLFPFFLIAGAMSLGSGYGGIAAQCSSSMFGAFICVSMSYPLLYLAGLFATGYLMKRHKYLAASLLSWTALSLFLALFFGAGVYSDLRHAMGK